MNPIRTAAEARDYLTHTETTTCRACGGTGTEYVYQGQYMFNSDCLECGGSGAVEDGHTDGWALPDHLDHDELPDHMQDWDR